MCNCNCDFEKCFEFDFIEGIEGVNIPKFTKKNLVLINVFLKYNSSYSAAENQEEGSYSKLLTDNKTTFFDFSSDKGDVRYGLDEEGNPKTILYRVIESIDKINSTHLASEGGGRKKDKDEKKNKGRVLTEKRIREIDRLEELLREGNAEVVETIASAFSGKNNFSFATKFCTYVSKYIFGNDHNKYCIYDKVVQSVLPVYIAYYTEPQSMKQYCHKKTKGNNKGQIVSDIDKYIKKNENEKNYEKYRKIISSILEGIKEKDGIEVTYEEFDHILWYYFKGSEEKVQKALNAIEQLSKLN